MSNSHLSVVVALINREKNPCGLHALWLEKFIDFLFVIRRLVRPKVNWVTA